MSAGVAQAGAPFLAQWRSGAEGAAAAPVMSETSAMMPNRARAERMLQGNSLQPVAQSRVHHLRGRRQGRSQTICTERCGSALRTFSLRRLRRPNEPSADEQGLVEGRGRPETGADEQGLKFG